MKLISVISPSSTVAGMIVYLALYQLSICSILGENSVRNVHVSDEVITLSPSFAATPYSDALDDWDRRVKIDENNEYEDVSVSETDEENQTAETGKQISVQKDLSVRSEVNSDEERNICTISLADLIGEGDRINSFTFAVESKNGENLGVLKGSYGIVVSDDCPSANSTGFYQTPDFETETDGSYAELTWNVPDEIADYVCADGEIMFGYWWGDADVITVKSVSCDFTHTAELQQ